MVRTIQSLKRKSKKAPITEADWKEYKNTHSVELRNRIVENSLPLVRYIADSLASKLPQHVDADDLYSAGVLGLFKAVDSFDVERGFKFETYSAQRVRGAILDDLRSNDWVPRLVRQKMHQVNRTRRELEGSLHRSPTRGELASALSMTEEEFQDLECEARTVNVMSLSDTRPELNEHKDLRKIDVLCDPQAEDPVLALQRRDAVERVCTNLSDKERAVLIMYYYENLTMKEIGKTIGLSESRVSQIHKDLCDRKRKELAELQEDFALS